MADVTMPRLSDTMQEGTIGAWLKKPGDQVRKGDVLAQVETDKATMDLTAFEAGTLQEILAPEGELLVPIGKAAVMKEGSDITLIGYSRMSVVALEVARRLEQEPGISCEVIDVRSLRPLDRPTIIDSVKKTSRAVIIEEDWYSYGIGAELAATIQEGAFDYLDAPVRRVAQAEVPLPYAKVMEQAALPKAQNLVDAIKSTLDASGYRARKSVLT